MSVTVDSFVFDLFGCRLDCELCYCICVDW